MILSILLLVQGECKIHGNDYNEIIDHKRDGLIQYFVDRFSECLKGRCQGSFDLMVLFNFTLYVVFE